MKKTIGEKIKELRTKQGLTLKDLSEKTNLSVSFLSQAERGLTSIAIHSLENIAEALGGELSYFFTPPKKHETKIMRSYEQEDFRIEKSRFIYYSLANDMDGKVLDPMLVVVLPGDKKSQINPYPHKGEEFVYVLEGILTVFIGDEEYQLYPGDSYHINSTIPHEWCNFTSKIVKLLSVNTPSVFSRK